MKRKIQSDLIAWSNAQSRRPLLLLGPRRVGKTWCLKELGKERFSGNLIHADFAKEKNLVALFDDTVDPRVIVSRLEAYYGQRISPEKTLIIFDEVQLCERALMSLKYFDEEDTDYHVTAAGSLLGVTLAEDRELFPIDSTNELTLQPMDFEEFCWALGQESITSLIKEQYNSLAKPGALSAFALHERALSILDDYLLVGGMPRVVQSYVDTRQLFEARKAQESILSDYGYDMAKYSKSIDSVKLMRVWDTISEQLAKENAKFKYSLVEARKGAEKYESSIWWLRSAGLVNLCTNVSDGVAPLKNFENPNAFKVYLADTGLLAAMYDARVQDLHAKVEQDSLNAKNVRFRGALTENYVMQHLRANGCKPYYWGSASKAEIEFVIRSERGDIVPIDAKSGRSSSASLHRFIEKYHCPVGIKISRNNFGQTGDIRTIPLYAAFCVR